MPTAGQVFALVSLRNRTFQALAQAGCIEKFVDALMWVLVPVFMVARGATLIEIGWVTGIYGLVWGASQFWTGPLSDRIGRKCPSAAVTGVGMALLYPTLIAAMSDIAHPS